METKKEESKKNNDKAIPAKITKILFADSDKEYSQRMIKKIEKDTSCKVVGVSNMAEALKCFKADKEIGLIISDFVLSDGTGEPLYLEIKNAKNIVPVIWVTDKTLNGIKANKGLENFEKDNPLNQHVDKKKADEVLEKKVSFVMSGGRGHVLESQKAEDYATLFLPRMPELKNFKYNYYSRLPGGKFFKVVDSDDPDFMVKIEKVQLEKNSGNLYMSKKDYVPFSDAMLLKFEELLANKEAAWEDQLVSQKQAIGFVHDFIRNRNFTKELFSMLQKLLGHIQLTVSRCENLMGVIDFVRERSDFVIEQAMLQSYISGSIALEMTGDITGNLRKLALGAIFQDLLVTYHPIIPPIENINGEEMKKLNDSEKILAKKHPDMLAQLLEKMEGIPPETIQLVKMHHERPDGSGFPQGLTDVNTPQFACINIFARDIAYRVCTLSEILTRKFMIDMVDSLKDRYGRGNYKEILQIYVENVIPNLMSADTQAQDQGTEEQAA